MGVALPPSRGRVERSSVPVFPFLERSLLSNCRTLAIHIFLLLKSRPESLGSEESTFAELSDWKGSTLSSSLPRHSELHKMSEEQGEDFSLCPSRSTLDVPMPQREYAIM